MGLREHELCRCYWYIFRRDNVILRAGFKSSDVLVETFKNSQWIIEEAAKISFLQVAISGPQKELDNLR